MFKQIAKLAAGAALSMIAAIGIFASASANQPPAGRLFMNPQASKCLDVPGITNRTPGTALQLYDCETNGFELEGKPSDQFWTFGPKGEIRNTLSNLCIDIANNNEGAALEIRACDGRLSQTWIVRADGFVQNQLTGKCIAVGEEDNANGETPLQLSSCEFTDPQSDQRWRV